MSSSAPGWRRWGGGSGQECQEYRHRARDRTPVRKHGMREQCLFRLSAKLATSVLLVCTLGANVGEGEKVCRMRYGYNERCEALHWNEISVLPAWEHYPVKPSNGISLDELHNQGTKMQRVRVRGHPRIETSVAKSEGVVPGEMLALATSTNDPATAASGRPCKEIDSLLRSCLDASQTDGVPNSSRCYWAPTPEEAVSCWCRVCDFQRAIEICSGPQMYQKCDACQMGRTLLDWTSSRCPTGFAMTVHANVLKGRNGVIEERWLGDVRTIAQKRVDELALERLHIAQRQETLSDGLEATSVLLLVLVLVSVVFWGLGVPASTIVAYWVWLVRMLVAVPCKLLEGAVLMCCYVVGQAPPGSLLALLRQRTSVSGDMTSEPTAAPEGFATAASTVASSPYVLAKSSRARVGVVEDTDEEEEVAGGEEDEGFQSVPTSTFTSPSKEIKSKLRDDFRRKLQAGGDEARVGERAEEFASAPTSPSHTPSKPERDKGKLSNRSTSATALSPIAQSPPASSGGDGARVGEGGEVGGGGEGGGGNGYLGGGTETPSTLPREALQSKPDADCSSKRERCAGSAGRAPDAGGRRGSRGSGNATTPTGRRSGEKPLGIGWLEEALNAEEDETRRDGIERSESVSPVSKDGAEGGKDVDGGEGWAGGSAEMESVRRENAKLRSMLEAMATSAKATAAVYSLTSTPTQPPSPSFCDV